MPLPSGPAPTDRDAIRANLRRLSEAAALRGDPLDWFEELYSGAEGDDGWIPWDDGRPNRTFSTWQGLADLVPGKALVVGCGLGDDAALLARMGWNVVAFDLSSAAVDWARDRHEAAVAEFPGSVEWITGDLTSPDPTWAGSFDFVLEVHILQAIPPEPRELGAIILPDFLGTEGHLLCVGRLKTKLSDMDGPPWPLEESWIRGIGREMELVDFHTERYPDDEQGVLRYRVVWLNT